MGKKSRLKKERRLSEKKQISTHVSTLNGKIIIYLALLILLTGSIFWQSLHYDFVNLDDNAHVYENPNILDLKWENISAMITGSRMGNWIPLTEISFALDYYFWGMDAFGFRLTNLILHLFNILLVFWLITLLTGNSAISLFSAFIFALHPMHVESVAWITERKDVLYAMLYLAALIAWIFYRNKADKKFFLISLVAFLLALTAKSMAVTLPLLMILYDIYYHHRQLKSVILDKLPFFVMAIGVIAVTWLSTYSSTTTHAKLNIPERLLMANYAFWFYPYKLLFPFRLSAIYPYPQDINQALPTLFYLLPLLTIALVWLLVSLKNKAKAITFWFWFYLLTIIPVLHLIPLAGSSITCDRFTYIPSIGLYMILILILCKAYKTTNLQELFCERRPAGAALVILLVLSAFYSFLSQRRLPVWENGVTLHSDIIAKYPQIELPFINRGKAYGNRGEHGKAIADFTSALSVSLESADAYNNRGNEYGELEEYAKGIADITKAIELRPHFVEAYSNRAHLYMSAGLLQEAENDFDTALKMDPNYAGGWYNRGNLFRRSGDYTRAIADYNQAINLDPDHAEAYNNRGTAHSMNGNLTDALQDFSSALSLQPDNVSFLNNRGNAYKDAGFPQKALADFNLAIKINPAYTNAYHNRAVVYHSLGMLDEARRDINQVKKMGGYINPAFQNILLEQSTD